MNMCEIKPGHLIALEAVCVVRLVEDRELPIRGSVATRSGAVTGWRLDFVMAVGAQFWVEPVEFDTRGEALAALDSLRQL